MLNFAVFASKSKLISKYARNNCWPTSGELGYLEGRLLFKNCNAVRFSDLNISFQMWRENELFRASIN